MPYVGYVKSEDLKLEEQLLRQLRELTVFLGSAYEDEWPELSLTISSSNMYMHM